MSLGTNHVTKTSAAVFIPDLWSDDVIAAYKMNLVLANLVTKINHKGKKGDAIHIPIPTRGQAHRKVTEQQVTLNSSVDTEKIVNINEWFEYSKLIEDIVTVQGLPSMRRFYTDDAGYALATRVDSDLHGLGASLGGGAAYSAAVAGGDGDTVWDSAAGNGTHLSDVGVRRLIRTLDDQDVPFSDRVFVVPPVAKEQLLGIDKFTLWSNVGEAGGANSIRNGRIGDLYGIPVYVSTNCPVVESDDGDQFRAGLFMHKEAMVFVEQMSVRSQTQYKQEYLSDLFTSDTIYGVGTLREDSGIAFIIPAD